jgi:hypothetical protein
VGKQYVGINRRPLSAVKNLPRLAGRLRSEKHIFCAKEERKPDAKQNTHALREKNIPDAENGGQRKIRGCEQAQKPPLGGLVDGE